METVIEAIPPMLNPVTTPTTATSLVEYTETVERLCKQLDRDKSTKVVLCIRGGPLVVPVCTAAALQRYELALAKLQKRSLLLVAALGSALSDLPLSLALACDYARTARLPRGARAVPQRGGAPRGAAVLAAKRAARAAPADRAPDLLRVAGTDVIGHSLAVSSWSSLGRARPARVQVHRTAPAAAT